MNRLLAETYPDAHCELDFTTPLELLVATILSAQCTDRRVNLVTPALFARYPDAAAYAGADRAELEDAHPADRLLPQQGHLDHRPRARRSCERFDGEVPGRLERPRHAARASGARRPTWCWATPSACPGITVDTHFGRLVRRFGWTDETDPDKVEAEIGALFPRRDWTMLSHHVIWHGRRCCHAKKPACGACPLARLCPSYGEGPTDPVEAAKLVTTEGPR